VLLLRFIIEEIQRYSWCQTNMTWFRQCAKLHSLRHLQITVKQRRLPLSWNTRQQITGV